ncbi:hypothetical protein [Luteitalea sp.]|uniref:hypothetical protein n=1 Tax=Luteitalea sp. TaxID=2004800 RepID=UPI0025C2338D|nr:hypothetical protein [Luteitalea sp.]
MNDTQWQDPALARDREDVQKHERLIAEQEAKWARLEARFDFVADQEREATRAVLPGLYARRDARLRRVAAGEERERIVNALMPVYATKLSALERRFEQMATSADAPDDDEFVELCQANLEVERLRLVLFEATQAEDFRRGFDAPRALRSHWEDVHRARERAFHLVGPGNKPRLGEPEWLQQARRLTELRAATTASKEQAHAVR